MASAGTSTQRTYRYLRLSILGSVLTLTVAVVQVLVARGPLASISASFYTPARGIFVGSLFAVGLALLALSGRSLERMLLAFAALFVPVIATVPTPIATGDVPGVVVACASRCVPVGEQAGVRNGMLALVVVGAVAVLTVLVLAIVERLVTIRLAVALVVAALVVVGVGGWNAVWSASFLAYGHLVATICFFACIALASVAAAVVAPVHWRVVYGALAAGILADLVWLAVQRVVFAGEAIAIVLFAVFWVAQTIQKWNELDPSFR